MPVRSLNSSVLKWPNRAEVEAAAGDWAAVQGQARPELRRLGYFGSYARHEWGVGSDLDLVAVVDESSEPFEKRALSWDLNVLPVPAEILIYTEDEWTQMKQQGSRFIKDLQRETVWFYQRP